jgi:hypothetical protein
MTLCKSVDMHNDMMKSVLEKGTLKNYFSTAVYLKRYLAYKYLVRDINLHDLAYSFITGFEFYIRNNPIKANDCKANDQVEKFYLEASPKNKTLFFTDKNNQSVSPEALHLSKDRIQKILQKTADKVIDIGKLNQTGFLINFPPCQCQIHGQNFVNEMDYPRKTQDRPYCLPLADQAVYR